MAYTNPEDRKRYHREWYRKNRKKRYKQIKDYLDKRIKNNQEQIVKFLQTHPCVDCGETDILVLEFDHRGEKEHNISNLIHRWSWKRILTEIQKCEVRCANCHKRRHAKENNNYKYSQFDSGWGLHEKTHFSRTF